MAELLFGSAPQLWPTMPMAAFGHLPAFPANRAAMLVHGGTADAAPPMHPGLPAAFDFGPHITPQALLAAVAMRRGQPTAPSTDQDVEDFIYDALDLLPGTNDVEVRCENGRVTMTGTVSHKRVKRDVGEVVWAIPTVNDVQNNVTIATRRRRGQPRETEGSPTPSGSRKPA